MPRRDKKKKSAVRCRKEEQREAPGTNFDERNLDKVCQVNGPNSFKCCSIFEDIRSNWTAKEQLFAIRAEAAKTCNEPSDDEDGDYDGHDESSIGDCDELGEDGDYDSHDESPFGDEQEKQHAMLDEDDDYDSRDESSICDDSEDEDLYEELVLVGEGEGSTMLPVIPNVPASTMPVTRVQFIGPATAAAPIGTVKTCVTATSPVVRCSSVEGYGYVRPLRSVVPPGSVENYWSTKGQKSVG
jgi:hypothetical protein